MAALEQNPPDLCLGSPQRRNLDAKASAPSDRLADHPDLLIRPAMPADTEAVSRMLARSYRALLAPDYAPALLREALPLIGLARPGVLTCGTYFIAEIDDRVLAAGGWTDLSPHGGAGRVGEGHMRHLAVDPDGVTQGLGRRIMERVLRSSSAAGIEVLHCQSTLTARGFYEAMGFDARAAIDVRLPTGLLFPAVQMIRRQGV
ncbi:GNAT family N-acetyltransferase [Pseudooceanicola algae]|uniref:Uncharacterized protein n=1 Tax=Pseudooceanicola algae TaxID=1537215 RepID=A0A418SKR5_9RHOB|nr:GNAT family N-acetyltransferase [Pseudooceanicola algae]QPM90991.1 hypothetical protein PSAL_022340 [Pseudooceanicola algae]